ncbi:MAG TPA: UDP-N-acetylmuramate dehydrogenase [Acidimicrobiales bacterium]
MSGADLDEGLHVAARILGELASRNEPLGARTTYRSGGSAALLVVVNDEDSLAVVSDAVRESGVEVLVVGNGSNLLIAERGFSGVVVALGPAYDWIRVEDETITAGGATALPVLARRAATAARPTLAWAVGIPGSVGGAVAMNAGGHGSDTASALLECRVADLVAGGIVTLRPDELEFSYRHSALRSTDVVVQATFAAPHGDAELAARSIEEIVRWRRLNQPGGRNAGSVFQNPVGDSAGRIIDELGLKGFRIGGASISEKHANFIQLDVGASSDDVAALIEAVIRIVEERAGVRLVPEVRRIGFD